MYNLKGSELRVVTAWENVYPFDVEVLKVSPTNYSLVDGYSVSILNELSCFLNFSYKLVPEVGSYEFNKSEIYGIDLFAAAYNLILSRAKIADPTFVTGQSKIAALLSHEHEGLSKEILFQPFTPPLWLTFIVLFGVICLAFSVTRITEKSISIIDSFYEGVAVGLKQCTNLKLYKMSSRISSWVSNIAVLIIMIYYSGGLVSFFAVQIFEINSVETLLGKRYTIFLERGYNNGSVIQSILESLPNIPVIKRLLHEASTSGFIFHSFDETIKRVESGPIAYLVDFATGYFAAMKALGEYPCTWSSIPIAGVTFPWSMYTSKGSRFKSSINYGILRLTQSGLLHRAGKKYYIPRGDNCQSTNRQSKEGVALENVYAAFGIYGVGLIVSVFILIVVENRKLSTKQIEFPIRNFVKNL